MSVYLYTFVQLKFCSWKNIVFCCPWWHCSFRFLVQVTWPPRLNVTFIHEIYFGLWTTIWKEEAAWKKIMEADWTDCLSENSLSENRKQASQISLQLVELVGITITLSLKSCMKQVEDSLRLNTVKPPPNSTLHIFIHLTRFLLQMWNSFIL